MRFSQFWYTCKNLIMSNYIAYKQSILVQNELFVFHVVILILQAEQHDDKKKQATEGLL
jgi:hypothetical protein